MFCKFCGAKIDSDAIFCESCGKRVKDTAVSAPVPSSDTTWLIKQPDGRHIDPISQNDLILKIKNGLVSNDTSIKKNVPSASWQTVSESPFGSYLSQYATSIYINDGWFWCLAVLPMLVSMALRYFNLLPFDPLYDWVIALALNAVFFFLDKRVLEEAGIFESWSYLGLVLIPVYLIARQIKTNHNFAPFIFNLFLLLMDFFIM